MTPYYEHDGIVIYRGNTDEVLKHFKTASFSTIVLDPPFTASMGIVMRFLRWLKLDGKAVLLAADGYTVITHDAGLNREHTDFPEIAPRAELGHMATRPIVAMQSILRQTRGPILDPYMGVGSTLLAAAYLGLEATGIELEEKYCRTAVARLVVS